MFDEKSILITGGTGSFGNKFAERILAEFNPRRIIIYSRDEYKQYVMMAKPQFAKHKNILRFFIGDVRDKTRLFRAMRGVDVVIHAAALKHVPLMEYNPIEAIKTNIHGAENVVNAALDQGVDKVVALSTDKAVNPINLYGATKLVSDKLFITANAYSGGKGTTFSVVRYGNVVGSRGSVIPFFQTLIDKGATRLPVTDKRMTRFWITLDQGVDLVFRAIRESDGGEIYVAKIPSFKISDLATAMSPDCEHEEVGIREGEKLHEAMITGDDSRTTQEYDDHYVIYPRFDLWGINCRVKEGGKLVTDRFRYTSDGNTEWLSVAEIQERLKTLELVY